MSEGMLVRRGEAMRLAGVKRWTFEKFLAAGIIRAIYLKDRRGRKVGRALFVRGELENLSREET